MKTKKTYQSLLKLLAATLILWNLLPLTPVHAAQLTSRKLTLGSSAGNTSTTWTFTFSGASATVLKGISFQVCDAASGTCNTPGSWSNSGATYSSLTYNGSSQSGWTLDNAGAGGAQFLGIKNNSASNSSANPIVATFNTVTNPNTTNATFYVRINTYTGNTFTTPEDSGVVAASTAQQISFTGSIDESLVFCVGTSGVTSSSCSGATGSTIAFGTFSSSSTKTGIVQLGAGTNASLGYIITVNGGSLTDGTHTITALSSQTASNTGSEQFGFNLRANTTPSFGSDPDGSGSATPNANYNTTNQYRFVSGDTFASASAADAFRRFQAAYIANIAVNSEAGNYTATHTYICTATF